MTLPAGRRQPEHEHARETERDHDTHGRRPRTDEEGRMGFLEHLDELRTRLIRVCLAIGAGMLVSFALVGKIRRDRAVVGARVAAARHRTDLHPAG